MFCLQNIVSCNVSLISLIIIKRYADVREKVAYNNPSTIYDSDQLPNI